MPRSVEVIGLPEVIGRFERSPGAVREALRRALQGLGQEVQARARALTPILKRAHKGRVAGALRESIHVRVRTTATSARVSVVPVKPPGADAYYAGFVEFGVVSYGTKGNRRTFRSHRRAAVKMLSLRLQGRYRTAPVHFMQKAQDAVTSRIDAAIRNAVLGALEGA